MAEIARKCPTFLLETAPIHVPSKILQVCLTLPKKYYPNDSTHVDDILHSNSNPTTIVHS